MKLRVTSLGLLVLTLFFIACASSQKTQKSEVATTLQTYRPGVTTFEDFARDARVVVQDKPAAPPTRQAHYLEMPGAHNTIKVWVAQRPNWNIYEQRETVSGPTVQPSSKTEFVVGDTHRPLALLTFTGATLSDLRVVP